MVKKVNNFSHYTRNSNKGNERIKKIQEIIDIIGGEPTQMTQVLDMCVDYVLNVLKVNPNEMENMNIYNMKRKSTECSKRIIIEPTFEEREMLDYIKKQTFIKNYADIYSYTLSCVAQIESEMEAYNDK